MIRLTEYIHISTFLFRIQA